MRFLIVEDNLMHARLLTAMVERAFVGSEVLRSGSLATARRLIDEIDIDAVFVDLYLPDGRGIDNVVLLRRRLPYRPIVVVTAVDDEESVGAVVDAGASDILVKGTFDADVVRRRILRALRHPHFRATETDGVLDRVSFVHAAGGQVALASRLRVGSSATLAVVRPSVGAAIAVDIATVADAISEPGVASAVVGRVSADHVALLIHGDEPAARRIVEDVADRFAPAESTAAASPAIVAEFHSIETGGPAGIAALLPGLRARVLRPRRPRVLVRCSDDSAVDDVVTRLADYAVTGTRSDGELERLAALEKPAVVILDATIARQGDLLKTLAGHPEMVHTAVVVLGDVGVGDHTIAATTSIEHVRGTVDEVLRRHRHDAV